MSGYEEDGEILNKIINEKLVNILRAEMTEVNTDSAQTPLAHNNLKCRQLIDSGGKQRNVGWCL